MIIFPAIDLKEGRCVRLEQGDMARATVFNDDPADQARAFAFLALLSAPAPNASATKEFCSRLCRANVPAAGEAAAGRPATIRRG